MALKKYSETAQLFDYTTMSEGDNNQYLLPDGTSYINESWRLTDYIPCNSNSVTLTRLLTNSTPSICGYDENKNYIAGVSYNNNTEITLTSQQTIKYIRFSWRKFNPTEDISQIMLNQGSTALPYAPYGIAWNDIPYRRYENGVWVEYQPKKYSGGSWS